MAPSARLGLLLLLGTSSCDNECDFFERCRGNVREVCGDGPDQVVGRRIRRHPCEAPNTTCVEIDEDHAACALPARATCDADFDSTCDGDLLVTCTPEVGLEEEPPGYQVGFDCASDGRVCALDLVGASCVAPVR